MRSSSDSLWVDTITGKIKKQVPAKTGKTWLTTISFGGNLIKEKVFGKFFR